jgi:hypothetical protein
VSPHPGELVFNVVWTGTVFDHLEPFVASQLAQGEARFRFVANACPPHQVAALEGFAAAHPDRVVEVLEVSTERMVRHGDALDEVLRTRDDGGWFAFVDPDIAALGPYLPRFVELLAEADVVTSGKEVWSAHNVHPAEHPGVCGEHFYDHDGYVFGSPHFAIYRRDPLLATTSRWGVGFADAGKDLSDAARARLQEVGRSYWIYDTAKLVNILLQADGHRLVHEEHPALLHIGGVSHFLAPPSSAPAFQGRPPAWGEGPDWGELPGMAARHEVARFTASVLAAALAGEAVPEVPADADPEQRPGLELVRRSLVELIATYPVLEREPRR